MCAEVDGGHKAAHSHSGGEVTRWPNGIRHPNSQFAMPPWDCGLSAVQEPETFIGQWYTACPDPPPAAITSPLMAMDRGEAKNATT